MRLLDELIEWLRIPSVSTGGGDPQALRAAAEWAAGHVRAAGGTAQLEEAGGPPLVVGELPSARAGAPTVLVYGHYDVQGTGPLDLWSSDPFEPDIRDGRIYARGAADDKGNFLPLLLAACELAAAGELPVNVRVLVEGEEEIGSRHVLDWIAADERGADCAVVFDSVMADERTPALSVAARGLAGAQLTVRTGEGDLHSGLHSGSPNAAHALARILGAVLPGPEGRPPAELGAGDEASIDVHGMESGSGHEMRTIVPAQARAALSVRVSPGRRSAEVAAALERLLREALPAGAELELEPSLAEPASFDPESPPLRLARQALARACGTEPVLLRLGGTLPLLSVLAGRGIPAIVTGFVVAGDAFHAPDESIRLEALTLGDRAARELLAALGSL